MPLYTVENKTNRPLGFHDAIGNLVEIKPGSKKDVELSVEVKKAISSASDLTFSTDGNESVTAGGTSDETANATIAALKLELETANATIEKQNSYVDGIVAELKKAKEDNELLAIEIEELKKFPVVSDKKGSK